MGYIYFHIFMMILFCLHIRSVPLQFQWKIIIPCVSSQPEAIIENENSVFKIEPVSGILQENHVTSFQILFNPHSVSNPMNNFIQIVS